jgi:hypothetical protein
MTTANRIAVVAILGVMPAMLLPTLAFRIWVRDFVPGPALAGLSIPLAVGLYVVMLGLMAPASFRRIRNSGGKAGLAALPVLFLGPLLPAVIAVFFVAGPLSYAMHRLEGPHAARQVVTIKEVLRGSRRCRFGELLVLEGSTVLFPRSVCVGAGHHAGDAVELQGDASTYGFAYRQVIRR